MQSFRTLLFVVVVLECSMHILPAAITTTPPSSVVDYMESNGGSGVNPGDIVFDEPSGSDNSLSNDIETGKPTDAPETEGTTEVPLADDEPGTTETPCTLETDLNCSSSADIVFSGQSDAKNAEEDTTNDLPEATTLSPSSE